MNRFEQLFKEYSCYVCQWEVSFLGIRSGEFYLEELLKLAEIILPYLLEPQSEVAA